MRLSLTNASLIAYNRAEMGQMKHIKQGDLKDVLSNAERELQETLAKAERLKEFINATIKLVGKRRNGRASQNDNLLLLRKRRRTSIIADHAADILKDAGHPLHVRDIVAKLREKGTAPSGQHPETTLAVALARRNDVFEKVAPSTFALVKREPERKPSAG
jgi:hypothetical protein